ncbi:putative chaperone protein [Caulobacter ginsengisoli]|uniref:Chaperone protein n=1 Tax=Caulobacter ginsengisoli TaxID=400775 RepID=A0ABU0IUU8_9CAUL|nr:Hsp70 family protein [Caulobacter ginsengisoli]MDQ0464908.1 putative chaperone protein [Caulobacter ginsengisoli]
MPPSRAPAIGIDFGTTNTVISLADGQGGSHLAVFPTDGGDIAAFRSALSFHAPINDPSGRIVEAGPWAIEAYLEEPLETRFIQSFKSYAASPLFTDTEILRRRFTFEDLLSAFLIKVRDHGGPELQDLPDRAIVGRPVNFAGLRPDPELAIRRYETAFGRLGFKDIRYAYEPVAAAFFFARQLKADATVLVADFGGGTSDFSLVRFEQLGGGRVKSTGLANSGVGVAGDAFDYRIIDNLVSPRLGKGGRYKAFDNLPPIPNRYFTAFARWEQLALLQASRDMKDIRGLMKSALQPEKIAWLVELLDDNHGYRLYQAVSRLKEALSRDEVGRFSFVAGTIRIEQDVPRSAFEGWIAPELTAMENAVNEALERAGLSEDQVDRVFLTGGSSFVPAVRNIFARRFGAEKLESGDELVSIASGLALIGDEADLDPWCRKA